MTTSFSYAANGDWIGSIQTQPFAALLVVVCSALFWGGLHVAATGVCTGPYAAAMIRPRTLIAATALAGAAWAYKVVTWAG